MGEGDLPAMRISDQDRAVVTSQLETAFADGRLDADELASRLKVVNRAKFRSDLEQTVSDLPVSRTPVAAQRPMGSVNLQGMAKRYSAFLIGPITCTLIYVMTSPGAYFWPMWVWFGCAVPIILDLLNRGGDANADDL